MLVGLSGATGRGPLQPLIGRVLRDERGAIRCPSTVHWQSRCHLNLRLLSRSREMQSRGSQTPCRIDTRARTGYAFSEPPKHVEIQSHRILTESTKVQGCAKSRDHFEGGCHLTLITESRVSAGGRATQERQRSTVRHPLCATPGAPQAVGGTPGQAQAVSGVRPSVRHPCCASSDLAPCRHHLL